MVQFLQDNHYNMEYISIVVVSVYMLTSALCQIPITRNFTFNLDFRGAVGCKYFVDKSLLLKEFLEDEFNKNYITSPSHFGKTLNLQMMKIFLQIQVDEKGLERSPIKDTTDFFLFKNLKINKQFPEFVDRHFGKYPVIFIDYGKLGHVNSYTEMLQQLRSVLRDAFVEHIYLLRVNRVWVENLNSNIFKKYASNELNEELSEYAIQNGFEFLAKVLIKYYNKKPIVLIDEYDSFVNGILFEDNEDVDRTIRLFQKIHRPFFTDSYQLVHKVFCTGTVHISGSGILSVDRELNHCAFLHKHRYSNYFGLLSTEMTEILKLYTNGGVIEPLRVEIQRRYGGYKLLGANDEIYNTLSVLKYLRNRNFGNIDLTQSQLTRPSNFRWFRPLFYKTNVAMKVIDLLQNRDIELLKINLFITKADVLILKCLIDYRFKETCGSEHQLVYKFLLQLGYITYKVNTDPLDLMYRLHIPNEEIRISLESILIDAVTHRFDIDLSFTSTVNSIFNGISESRCTDIEFETLYSSLNNLISSEFCSVNSVNDLQIIIFAILRCGFHNMVQSRLRTHDNSIQITMKNNNNITFAIVTNIVIQHRKVPINTVRESALKALDESIDIIQGIPRIVCLGLGIGLAIIKEVSHRTLGLTVSKNILPGDDLNKTISFA